MHLKPSATPSLAAIGLELAGLSRTIDQKAVGLRQISTIVTSCLGHYRQNPKTYLQRTQTYHSYLTYHPVEDKARTRTAAVLKQQRSP
jgi:hypothetical protein